MTARLASQPPRHRAPLWGWLLALLLLALLVWVVGRRGEHRERPEIGVSGEREEPLLVAPSPRPFEDEVVSRPPPAREEPAPPAPGGEPAGADPVPASPSPRR